MKSIKRFQAAHNGASTYLCRICKHNTRNVGGDEMGVRLCLPCYELAGIENALSDNGLDDTMQYADEVVRYINQLEKRGTCAPTVAAARETFKELLVRHAAK